MLRVRSRYSLSWSVRDYEGVRPERVGDQSGRRRIPPASAKPKVRPTLISPAAVQGRLLVPVSAPPCRARDHLVQPPGWRSQALRLRQRRVPEIDDVLST